MDGESGFGSAPRSSFGGQMNWLKKLEGLLAAARINAEAPTRPVERSIVENRYQRAIIKRTPVRGRERGI